MSINKFLFLFLISIGLHAQNQILVPCRSGDLWGLSDLNGKIKVKPIYNYMEPIGSDFYQYAYEKTTKDTIRYVSGYVEIKDKLLRKTGVLKGTSEIIAPTEHQHFTYASQGLLIGTEESYITENSNFYTIQGVKLLKENVKRFRFIGNDKDASPFLSILLEHYNNTFSLVVFDTQLQKWDKPLFENVTDFKFDYKSSNEDIWVCTYVDANYNYYNMAIIYDKTKKKHEIKPYTKEYHSYNSRYNEVDVPIMENNGKGTLEIESEPVSIEEVVEEVPRNTNPTPVTKVDIPKFFQKVNDSTAIYGKNTFQVAHGEKIFFPDYYTKTMQQPLIYQKGNQFGLQISDSLRSIETYDSLRYVKNQYGIFTSSHNYFYLIGKKQQDNSWLMGLIDQSGKVIIPMQYSHLSPNLPEIYFKDNTKTNKEEFGFRQPYNYYDDKKQLLTLQRDGNWEAEQNGKLGVINTQNKVLLPFEFDKIWHNGLSFLKTMRISNDFNVYQKGDKYGVFYFDQNGSISQDTGPVFNKIPVYVYKDYLGQKGLDIYNLADEYDLYFCLAKSNGELFYRE